MKPAPVLGISTKVRRHKIAVTKRDHGNIFQFYDGKNLTLCPFVLCA